MEFAIEPVRHEDIPVARSIMEECVAALSNRDFFVDDQPEAIAERLDAGFALFARHDGEAIAYLMIDIPGEDGRNLGYDLGWSGEELLRSAHIDSACVRPAFRGHGLMKRLVSEGEKEMRRRGIVHGLATVHPDNVASLSSMLALGYRIGTTKEKYGGLPRHVLFKHLTAGEEAR